MQDVTLPPYDETIEQQVLGAMMVKDVAVDVMELITETDFYLNRHQRIFAVMAALSRENEPVDYLTVGARLDSGGGLEAVGGRAYLAELVSEIASAANVQVHAKIVKELASLRALRVIGTRMVEAASQRSPSAEIAAHAESAMFDAMWGRQVKAWRTSEEVMIESLEALEKAQANRDGLNGVPTGLTELDRMIGGWQPTDLVIIAARPSMGKTAFAVGATLAAAKAGKHVACVSLEMSTRQLGARFLAQEAQVSVFHILSGKLWGGDDQAVRRAAMRLAPLPIYYEETGIMTMDRLRAKARQLRVKGQLDVLFLDYLQLMQGTARRDSRQVEVSEISRGLKLLAKELDITVIAMSQLSRKCEEREDKRPILSDLRESGAIEQDADLVIGLYRDAVYHKETLDAGVAEILIRKHRNGPIGDVLCAFTDESAKFSDLPVRI